MKRIRIPIWSRLTRVQRILLAAVVAIVVLFVVAEGVGAGQGKGDPSRPPGFVNGLGDLFGEPDRVDPADLSGPCVPVDGMPADGLIAIGGTCVLRVDKADAGLRQLKMHARGGLTVEAPIPRGDEKGDGEEKGGGETAVRELANGEDLTVTIDAAGADITLTCVGTDSCGVELS